MAWFKVDDQLHSHPKARQAGLAAMGLWVAAGSHAAMYVTDGFVPDWYVKSWPGGARCASALVDARLWERVDGGWTFRDWADYQPTSEELAEEREKAKERQRRFRQARREAKIKAQDKATDRAIEALRNGVTNGVTNGVGHAPCNGTPYPSRPDPDPAPSISNSPKGGNSPKQAAGFDPQPCGREHDPAAPCGACGRAREEAKAAELKAAREKSKRDRAASQAAAQQRRAEAEQTLAELNDPEAQARIEALKQQALKAVKTKEVA